MLTFDTIADTIGIRKTEIDKIMYVNMKNNRRYTVLSSNPKGLDKVMADGDKISVVKKKKEKRKQRPSEDQGEKLKRIAKDRFTKYDYAVYLKNQEHVQAVENMRDRICHLFGGDNSAGVIIMNRTSFICPFKTCRGIVVPNDVGGNIASFIKHLSTHHCETESGRLLIQRWKVIKENTSSIRDESSIIEPQYDLSTVTDIELPLTTHRLYCDLSIISDMMKAPDRDAAKKILDSKVKNYVTTDWNYDLKL